MKIILLSAIIIFFAGSVLTGQSDVTISKKEFKTDKPGFDAAWQHVKVGDSFYSRGGLWYGRAATEYKTAYIYNGTNAELNYKLGVSCLFSDSRESASEFLLKALSTKSGITSDILLLTGRALQYAGRYSEAVKRINEWLSSPLKKSSTDIERANRYLNECSSALIIMKDTLRVEIKNMGSNINSNSDEYSQIISRDGQKIYFASRRSISPEASINENNKSDENIYRSDVENGKWSVALPAGKKLITDMCETPIDIDSSGTVLYIYAGYLGNGDIMVAEFRKGEWRSPEPESFGISSDAPETSLSICPSGSEIAFISDRGKKGAGGKDIWFIYKDGRKWSKPVNAGVNINSEKDEESVRYSRGGDSLWFSSAGHNSTGGFDIMLSIRKKGEGWTKARNAGFPVNTQWDEFFYFPSPLTDNEFFLSSNRGGGFGGLDIYMGRFLPPVQRKTEIKPDTIKTKVDSIPALTMHKPDTIKTVFDSIPAVMMIKPDTIKAAPDSIPALIQAKPDTLIVRDTSAVKIVIIK